MFLDASHVLLVSCLVMVHAASLESMREAKESHQTIAECNFIECSQNFAPQALETPPGIQQG